MMNKTRQMELFLEIHSNLPREGPGCFEATEKAFYLLPNLPKKPNILDIGCGPGMQTIHLSKLTEGTITAVDNHQSYLDILSDKVQQKELAHRIKIVHGDMFNLVFPEHTFDLIWAEGSIYIMGVEKALQQWKIFLKQQGFIVFSEISWLKNNIPLEIRNYWQTNYPLIQDIEGNINIIKQTGYQYINHFVLPESAWWDNYYNPLQNRLLKLKEKYKDDEMAINLIATDQQEIDFYQQYSPYYGYVFYLAQSA